jgi:CheY-like chemotaxis protein
MEILNWWTDSHSICCTIRASQLLQSPLRESITESYRRGSRESDFQDFGAERTGVALALTRHPKLILLDLNLPDMHGSEVIQRLQKDPATARIPVVVISGDATPSQIERLLVLGAQNYLTKPFEPAPFLAVIDEIMQESAAARTT